MRPGERWTRDGEPPCSIGDCAAMAACARRSARSRWEPGLRLADRTFDARMNGFNSAASAAVDAGDNVWITDVGRRRKRTRARTGSTNTTPSRRRTCLRCPTPTNRSGTSSLALQLAVDDATGELFVAQSNGRAVDIFAPKGGAAQCKEEVGEPVCYTHAWTRINAATAGSNPKIHVAIDNTDTFSQGRVYLSLTSPENDVEVLDDEQRPVDFPATASYINEQQAHRHAERPIRRSRHIAVDSRRQPLRHRLGQEGGRRVRLDRHLPPHLPGAAGTPGLLHRRQRRCRRRSDQRQRPDLRRRYDSETGEGAVKEFDDLRQLPRHRSPSNGGEFYAIGPARRQLGRLRCTCRARTRSTSSSPLRPMPKVTYTPVASPTATGGHARGARSTRTAAGQVTECEFEYGAESEYQEGAVDPYASAADRGVRTGGSIRPTTDVSAPISGLTTGDDATTTGSSSTTRTA